MNTVEVPRCPACAAADYEVLGSTDNGDPTLAFEWRRCRHCGLYFKSRRPDQANLDETYASFDVTLHDTPHDTPLERLMRDKLAGLPAGSRVLDFGCCAGRFLMSYVGHLECYGIEVNTAGRALAQQRGLRLIDEDQLAGQYHGFFDAVLMHDVFEHLPTPTATVRRLSGALRPGGRLLVATGLGDAIPRSSHMAEFWYLQMPWHLHMLSRVHSQWLARELGMELSGLEACAHYHPGVFQAIKIRAREWAYSQFHDHPDGSRTLTKALLRLTPRLRAVETLRSRASRSLKDDHALVILSKPRS